VIKCLDLVNSGGLQKEHEKVPYDGGLNQYPKRGKEIRIFVENSLVHYGLVSTENLLIWEIFELKFTR
jgi:hypothetical protein